MRIAEYDGGDAECLSSPIVYVIEGILAQHSSRERLKIICPQDNDRKSRNDWVDVRARKILRIFWESRSMTGE